MAREAETLLDLQDGLHQSSFSASLNIFTQITFRVIFFARWLDYCCSASSNSLLDPQRSSLLFMQIAAPLGPSSLLMQQQGTLNINTFHTTSH
jgi:hypothetical protein